MLNQCVLVGRISKMERKDDINKLDIIISVPRNYKNENGEYENDLITCTLFKGLSDNIIEYCLIGDLVGIKGRLQNIDNSISLIADKVTFLSTRKEEE